MLCKRWCGQEGPLAVHTLEDSSFTLVVLNGKREAAGVLEAVVKGRGVPLLLLPMLGVPHREGFLSGM